MSKKSGRSLSKQNRESDEKQNAPNENGHFYIIMYIRQLPDINMALVQGERSAEFGQFRNKSNIDNAMLFVITNNPYYFMSDLRDVIPLMLKNDKKLSNFLSRRSFGKIQSGNLEFIKTNEELLRDLFPKLQPSSIQRLLEKPVVRRISKASERRAVANKKKQEKGGFYCESSARNFSLLEENTNKDSSNEEFERTVVCVMGPIATRQIAQTIYQMWSPQLRGANSHTARGVHLANMFGVHIFINPYGFYMVDSRAVQIRELIGDQKHRKNVRGYEICMTGSSEQVEQ